MKSPKLLSLKILALTAIAHTVAIAAAPAVSHAGVNLATFSPAELQANLPEGGAVANVPVEAVSEYASRCFYQYQWFCDSWGRCAYQYVYICY